MDVDSCVTWLCKISSSFFFFSFSKLYLICFEPLNTRWEIQCLASFYSHSRGLERPRTSERSPVVFGPLQSSHASLLTERLRTGISDSCIAWA